MRTDHGVEKYLGSCSGWKFLEDVQQTCGVQFYRSDELLGLRVIFVWSIFLGHLRDLRLDQIRSLEIWLAGLRLCVG